MTKPLAIDLFCGLGGWTDGLLAEGYTLIDEGYLCYDLIWHTKLVPSQTVSGKRSKNHLIAGFGLPLDNRSDMGNLLSRKGNPRSARIACATRWKSVKFLKECRFFIDATTPHACALTTYSSALRPIISGTCGKRAAGGTGLGIKAASVIRTLFSLMRKSRRCFLTSQMAGGL